MSRTTVRNALVLISIAVLGYSGASYADRPPMEHEFCHPSEEECQALADSVYDACMESSPIQPPTSAWTRMCNSQSADAYRACREEIVPCF